MKKMALTALAALALSLSSGVVLAAPAMFKAGVLTDNQGRTLYTFDKDIGAPGKSVCNAQCATNWPPLAVAPNAAALGDYTIITRADGARQDSHTPWFTLALDPHSLALWRERAIEVGAASHYCIEIDRDRGER